MNLESPGPREEWARGPAAWWSGTRCLIATNVFLPLSSRENTARDFVDTACQLSPLDPMVYAMHSTRALSFIVEGDYEAGAKWAEAGARSPNAHYLIGMIAVLAPSLNGVPEKAAFWQRKVAIRRPDADQCHFFKSFPFIDPAVRHRLSSALMRSGY